MLFVTRNTLRRSEIFAVQNELFSIIVAIVFDGVRVCMCASMLFIVVVVVLPIIRLAFIKAAAAKLANHKSNHTQ